MNGQASSRMVMLNAAEPDDGLVRLSRVIEIKLNDKGEVPTEFLMFSPGMNETTKGTFLFDKRSAESCMARAADMGMRQNIDYEHASMYPPYMSPDPAETHKSAGSYSLSMREDQDGNVSCFASDVKWTAKAKEKILSGEFRHISPVFRHEEDGLITEVRCCALTNDPATKRQKPLIAASNKAPKGEEHTVNPMLQQLITLLSLRAGATEADALLSVQASKASMDELLALTDSKSVSEAKGKLLAWKDASGKVEALSKELAELKLASRAADVKALIDAALGEGKVVPAEVEFLSSMGLKDIDQLKGYLAVKPKVVPGTPPSATGKDAGAKPPAGENAVALSAEDLEVATMLGNDTKKLAESKAKVMTLRVGNIGSKEAR